MLPNSDLVRSAVFFLNLFFLGEGALFPKKDGSEAAHSTRFL